MNGSIELREADIKPFALCPVCLRKVSSHMGINGQELQYIWEVRDIFELMNYNDMNNSFSREISLLTRVIDKLVALYSTSPHLPQDYKLSHGPDGNVESIHITPSRKQCVLGVTNAFDLFLNVERH